MVDYFEYCEQTKHLSEDILTRLVHKVAQSQDQLLFDGLTEEQ